MKVQLFIGFIVFALTFNVQASYYERTEWYPGCACGIVSWQTQYTSKSACESAVCKTYFYRTEWWPGCQCSQVNFESKYSTLDSCQNEMCGQVEVQFQNFISTYNKTYATEEEKKHRFTIFNQNLQFIYNNPSAELGINQFTDMDLDEFKTKYTGQTKSQEDIPYTHGSMVGPDEADQSLIDQAVDEINNNSRRMLYTGPAAQNYYNNRLDLVVIDWREKNAVTAVKDQNGLANCWIFAGVGALEGLWSIKNVGRQRFSEQHMCDCLRPGNGCEWGWPQEVYNYTRREGKGINTEEEYKGGLYHNPGAQNAQCNIDPFYQQYKTASYQDIPPQSPDKMRSQLRKQPLSIAFQVQDGFRQFNGSIYNDTLKQCSGGDVNHAMLLVGYGYIIQLTPITLFGITIKIPVFVQGYWIVKNSWGTSFGKKGYIKVNMLEGSGVCNINNFVSYPTQ